MKRYDLLCLARLVVQITRTQLRDHASKFATKRYTQPSLLVCLCLKAFLRMDYRSCEALLASAQELRAALGLHGVPDHSTLWWFGRYKVKPHLLGRMLTATVRLFTRAIPPRSRTVLWIPRGLHVPRPAPTTSSGPANATVPDRG
jgi:hypothetical protein